MNLNILRFNNNIFKQLSALLITILIANSFLFIAFYKPKETQAVADGLAGSSLIVGFQTAWNAIVKAWDWTVEAANQVYKSIDTAFTTWQKSESILAQIAYSLVYITVQILLQRMTENIVNWLNGGAEGKLVITEDFGKLSEEALDLAGGEVVGGLLGLNNNELCNPNFLKVRLKVAIDLANQPTFQERFKCSFTGGVENLKNFRDSFKDGGWKGFVQLKRGQNNEVGQFLRAQSELKKKQKKADKEQRDKLSVSSGFNPQEVCRVTKDLAKQEEGFNAFTGEDQEQRDATDYAGGTFSVGKRMKDIMGNFDYNDLGEFKLFWKNSGGDFACKIETPATVIKDTASKVFNAPIDKLNNITASVSSNLGKSTMALLKPYIEAIGSAALNLAIKKGEGWINGQLEQTKPRTTSRPKTTEFQNASKDLSDSQGLLANANNLKNSTFESLLSFSQFVGLATLVSEKKNILYEDFVSNTYLNFTPSDQKLTAWLTDNPLGSALSEKEIYDITLATIKGSSSFNPGIDPSEDPAYPTLTAAGAFYASANACGAFAQESTPNPNTKTREIVASESVIIPNNATETYLYDDDSDYDTSIIDRIVRLYDNDSNPLTPPEALTIIGGATNKIKKIGGTTPGQPIDPNDPNIYADYVRFVFGATLDNYLAGKVFTDHNTGAAIKIEGSRYPAQVFSRPSVNCPSTGPGPLTYRLQYTPPANSSSIGYINALVTDSVGTVVCNSQAVASIDWSAMNYPGSDPFPSEYSPVVDPQITTTVSVVFPDPNTCPNQSISINAKKSTGLVSGSSRTSACSLGSLEISNPTFSSNENLSTSLGKSPLTLSYLKSQNKLGIPAIKENTSYTMTYFSPSIKDATASIENTKFEIFYDDFQGYSAGSLQNLNVTPSAYPSRKNGVNMNPFKLRLLDFYPQITSLSTEISEKIRVLLGYNGEEEININGLKNIDNKNNLSGITAQLGSIPDNDGDYVSVSDALDNYNRLSQAYQDIFLGISSESTLEALDTNFETLSPLESNIKIALIGQRCPSLPPTEESNPDLIIGCPGYNATTYDDSVDSIIPSGLSDGDPKPGTGEYNMGGKFMFLKDPINGFATNPFYSTAEESASVVLAGLLNLDEMTQQLAILPPDKNIIKLIRIRQILEQLQVSPQSVISYGPSMVDDKSITNTTELKLEGVDQIKLSLRNYPEIEYFLNLKSSVQDTSGKTIPTFTPLDPNDSSSPENYVKIENLIDLYGLSNVSKQEAYAKISADLEKILPEIITQIQDKLKAVFLKRIAQNVEDAKQKAQKRLIDFVFFAEDLTPTVQLQVPEGAIDTIYKTSPGAISMTRGNENSFVFRIASERTKNYLGASIDPLDGSPLNNCMSITGEPIVCGSAEQKLRGFEVRFWENFKNSFIINTNAIVDYASAESNMSKLIARKAIMAGIRSKITKYNKIMGVDVNSLNFQKILSGYTLSTAKNDNHTQVVEGHDGSIEHVDYEAWDTAIQDGLDDLYTYFAGYSDFLQLQSSNTSATPPKIESGGYSTTLTTDVTTKMNTVKNSFSMLKDQVKSITNEFTNGGATIISLKQDLKSVSRDLNNMNSSYEKALGCASVDKYEDDANNYGIDHGGIIGIVYKASNGNDVYINSYGLRSRVPSSLFEKLNKDRNFIFGFGALSGTYNYISPLIAQNEPSTTAEKDGCAKEAQKFNSSLLGLSSKFICGL